MSENGNDVRRESGANDVVVGMMRCLGSFRASEELGSKREKQ